MLAAGVAFFAFPLAGNADSFEEFMAKKQRKEREEQARKQVQANPTLHVQRSMFCAPPFALVVSL